MWQDRKETPKGRREAGYLYRWMHVPRPQDDLSLLKIDKPNVKGDQVTYDLDSRDIIFGRVNQRKDGQIKQLNEDNLEPHLF